MLNSVSHGIGALLAITGLILLYVKADTLSEYVSVSIYGLSLTGLFLASTFYHSANRQELKQKLKALDHAAIYWLIAGTYTPILTAIFSGLMAWLSLTAVWLVALIGSVLKLTATHRFKKLGLLMYLGLGWCALLLIDPMQQHLQSDALWWLIAGGICFSVGVLFYIAKKIQFTHAIWHCFVVAGCTCHFLAIYWFVL